MDNDLLGRVASTPTGNGLLDRIWPVQPGTPAAHFRDKFVPGILDLFRLPPEQIEALKAYNATNNLQEYMALPQETRDQVMTAMAQNVPLGGMISGKRLGDLMGRGISARKPTKIVNELRWRGLLDAGDDPEEIGGVMAAALRKRDKRLRSGGVNDPLADPGRAQKKLNARRVQDEWMKEKAETESARRAKADKLREMPGREHWSKKLADAVDAKIDLTQHTNFGLSDVQRAVDRANLEAVPRMLKKEGWTVRHASTGAGGRRSSRYLVSPDGKFEVRLSDHELPDTMERAHNRSQTGGPRWNDEVILDGTDNPLDVVARIKNMLSGT